MDGGLLKDGRLCASLREAWVESRPGSESPREEGGFILRAADGSYTVERWPRGSQDQIEVPDHPGGQRGGLVIVATFHTHPNAGPEYLQEPSLTDIRAVRHDPDLRHPEYEGEFVISRELVYQIAPSGNVEVAGATVDLLGDS